MLVMVHKDRITNIVNHLKDSKTGDVLKTPDAGLVDILRRNFDPAQEESKRRTAFFFRRKKYESKLLQL